MMLCILIYLKYENKYGAEMFFVDVPKGIDVEVWLDDRGQVISGEFCCLQHRKIQSVFFDSFKDDDLVCNVI